MAVALPTLVLGTQSRHKRWSFLQYSARLAQIYLSTIGPQLPSYLFGPKHIQPTILRAPVLGCKQPQLGFYNLSHPESTPSGFVNLKVSGKKLKSEWRKRGRIIFFIILLDNLYYFIGLYRKIKIGMDGEL